MWKLSSVPSDAWRLGSKLFWVGSALFELLFSKRTKWRTGALFGGGISLWAGFN